MSMPRQHSSPIKTDFDVDSDGQADKGVDAAAGSGFLALDKNSDGKVNNGSELFGAQSGNGFADPGQV